MDNNFLNTNQPAEKPSIWVSNPHLKTLFLVLIFVFLFSGIGLAAFNQIQTAQLAKQYNIDVPVVSTPHKIKSATSTPSQANIEGWKTYKNDKFGFEFKYPKEWTVEEYDPVKAKDVAADSDDILWVNFRTEKNILFSIEIRLKSDPFLIKNSTGQANAVIGSSSEQVPVYFRETSPNQKYECYGVNNLRGTCSDQFSVMINNSGSWFIIDGLLENGKIPSTYTNILSTFKFTGQPDTSTWKTYKNEEYGFEFKYPEALVENKKYEDKSTLIALQIKGSSCICSVSISTSSLNSFLKPSDNFSYWVKKDYTVDNINGFRIESETPEGGLKSLDIIIPHNSLVYVISYCDEDNLEQIFDQILSTFKFTK